MRNITTLLLALAMLVSCSKKNDPAAEPELNGTYNIDALVNLDGETLQFPTSDPGLVITSVIEVTLPTKNRIDLMRKGTAGGTSYLDYLGQYEIKKNTSADYDVLLDSKIIGVIGSNNLYLDFQGKSKNSNIVSITGKKK